MSLTGWDVANKEEVIIKTKDVSVRIIELAPHEAARWHYHSEVTDNMFCLIGKISVCLKDPNEEVFLSPGQRCEVAQGRVHQVTNVGGNSAKYLLAQGVGNYDFSVVDS